MHNRHFQPFLIFFLIHHLIILPFPYFYHFILLFYWNSFPNRLTPSFALRALFLILQFIIHCFFHYVLLSNSQSSAHSNNFLLILSAILFPNLLSLINIFVLDSQVQVSRSIPLRISFTFSFILSILFKLITLRINQHYIQIINFMQLNYICLFLSASSCKLWFTAFSYSVN